MAGSPSARLILEHQGVHTFNALQHLVMAMADVANNSGKKTFFGRDKGQQSYTKFLEKLRATLHSMVLDGLISEADSERNVLAQLESSIRLFQDGFPNWQEAYEFAAWFLSEQNEANASAVISRLRT